MKRTNIWLTDKQVKWLRRNAKARGLKQAELVRRAVDAFIEREDRKK